MDLARSAMQAAKNGFDFTASMRTLCRDLTLRLPELSHIDIDRVSVAFSQARKRVSHGLYATLTPMRFEGGSLSIRRRGREYMAQRLYDSAGREQLYILRFYLPRFMETGFMYKLATIVHELWHIGPEFDGDLRRHAGRCYAHTHSQQQYDHQMEQFARRYLDLSPPDETIAFLRLSFRELIDRHGSVRGVKVRQPKLIPVA
jgi:predicted metallopeptidase